MIPRWLLLPLLLSPGLAQFAARPDMTFNEDNDRYDVGNIIAVQNREFRDQPTEMDMDMDGRRFADDLPLVEYLEKDRQRYEEERRGKSVRRILAEQEDREKYARNLAAFQRQSLRRILSRRTTGDSLVKQNLGDTFNVENSAFKEGIDKQNLEKPLDIGNLGVILDKETISNDNEPVRHLDKYIESSHFEEGKDEQKNAENKHTEEESLLAKLVREAVLKRLQQGMSLKAVARRLASNPDNDLLLQYAVPINLKVNGYLEIPQDV